MDWMWSGFWGIFWNAFIHLITANWSALQQDGEDIKGWWRSLWHIIATRLDNLKGWAEGRISWLKGYAFGLFYRLGMDAVRWVGDLRTDLTGWINNVITWFHDTRTWLIDLAYRLKNEAIEWATARADQVRVWAETHTNAARQWLYDTFVWIQSLRDLLSNWLVGAQGVINWLWHHAWGHLQAFLSNPIGYVLGAILPKLLDVINWWQVHGQPLIAFVVEDLPRLRNLLAAGFAFLRNLVENPMNVILEVIAPVFIDWLAHLIEENW